MSGFSYRSLPLWLQWLLPFALAAAFVVALVWFVHRQTNDLPQIAKVTNKAALVEQNREDRIVVRQQQAPHLAKVTAGQNVASAAQAAVVGYIHGQIKRGVMDGPVTASRCSSRGGTSTRQALRCTVTASNGVVTYPFDVVVQPSAARVIFCQRVAPPVPSMNVPVSKRCV